MPRIAFIPTRTRSHVCVGVGVGVRVRMRMRVGVCVVSDPMISMRMSVCMDVVKEYEAEDVDQESDDAHREDVGSQHLHLFVGS